MNCCFKLVKILISFEIMSVLQSVCILNILFIKKNEVYVYATDLRKVFFYLKRGSVLVYQIYTASITSCILNKVTIMLFKINCISWLQ